jgi:hypothetical protein
MIQRYPSLKRLSIQKTNLFYIVLALILFLHLAWLVKDIPVLINYAVSDDSFYFIMIAKNVVAGNGFSFDGIHATNGFQPLWLFLLLPLALIKNKTLLLLALLALQSLLNILFFILLYALIKRLTNAKVALISIVFIAFNPFLMPRILLNGMETSLSLFTATLLVYYFVNNFVYRDPTRINYLVLSIISLLSFFARLDNVFLISSVYLFILIHYRKRIYNHLPKLLLGSLPFLLVIPYLISNYRFAGSIIPISGIIKSLWHESCLSATWSAGTGIVKYLFVFRFFITDNIQKLSDHASSLLRLDPGPVIVLLFLTVIAAVVILV